MDLSQPDKAYKGLIEECMLKGEPLRTRNANVLRLIGKTIEFNSTPLITTRKCSWKNALREMEYFMKGYSHLDYIHPAIRQWWEPFCTITPNTMLYSYGTVLRRLYSPNKDKVIEINRIKGDTSEGYYGPNKVDIDTLTDKGTLTGKKFSSKEYGDFIVLDRRRKYSNYTDYNIQFINTGFVRVARSSAIKNGTVKDPYFPKEYGVGYFGIPNKHHPRYNKLRMIWDRLLNRCYNEKCKDYSRYGKRGVKVCNRWLCFEYFVNDISKVAGYEEWFLDSDSYQLDKDYYGSNIYSVSSCIFLPKKWNVALSKALGKYLLIKDNKVEKEFLTKADIGEYLGISRHLKPLKKMGYRIELVKDTENTIYRYPILIDQISNVINSIKKHPYSRRNIITTWIPQHVESGLMNPTNCHNTETQFFIKNDKLIIETLQRSADLIVGIPHNFIQEYALGLYIAKCIGVDLGNISYKMADCHIYEQHFGLAAKIMNQQPKDSPQLIYTPTSEEFKASDFTLDREYYPSLTDRAEMVV